MTDYQSAITHCDNCGCDWLDNGLNPIGCPYCKQTAQAAEIEALRAEVERLFDEIERLLDSREREGDRLDWLLARLPGDVIRDLVGEMRCTSDVAEWRHRIDKAARFNPRPGEFGG